MNYESNCLGTDCVILPEIRRHDKLKVCVGKGIVFNHIICVYSRGIYIGSHRVRKET